MNIVNILNIPAKCIGSKIDIIYLLRNSGVALFISMFFKRGHSGFWFGSYNGSISLRSMLAFISLMKDCFVALLLRNDIFL
jgi:hypothetical protein